MIASVQIVDLGTTAAIRAIARRPRVGDVPGLRSMQTADCTPLGSMIPLPTRRVGLIAFWDDVESADHFVETDPIGQRFSGGLQLRLRPLRAHGTWPGLPEDTPAARAVPHDGPVAVLTLGDLHLTRTVRFLRTSRPPERAAVEHEGLLWGTIATRPPFVATVSLWRDSTATAAYAYGQRRPEHHLAIVEQQRKDFHRESAFVRFAPERIEGALHGRNPVDATQLLAT